MVEIIVWGAFTVLVSQSVLDVLEWIRRSKVDRVSREYERQRRHVENVDRRITEELRRKYGND
jgi:hypothetical protein